jgi:hypothetical protein
LESLKRPNRRVKCLPIRRPRMTRILRDSVSRDVERAVVRDAVVRFSSRQCLVKVREVFSSTPRTRYVYEGQMEGMGEVCGS